MKIFQLAYFVSIFFGLMINSTWSQNFDGINLQFQTEQDFGGTVNVEIILLNYNSDTIWREEHASVTLSQQNSFSVMLGKGSFLSGSINSFQNIDWKEIEMIKVYRVSGSQYLLGEMQCYTLPYALHSLRIEYVPSTAVLTDVSPNTLFQDAILKYDGNSFVITDDVLADSVLFAYESQNSVYSDTALYAYSYVPAFVDTVLYTYQSDSSNYTINSFNSVYADTAGYADSSEIATLSTGNWLIGGNQGLNGSNFLGTTNAEPLIFQTNSNIKLKIGQASFVNGGYTNSGLFINGNNGVLHSMSNTNQTVSVQHAYLFMNGGKRGMGVGYTPNLLNLDTLQGLYSFHAGYNVQSKGSYSNIFGLNSWADTLGNGGDPTSAFVHGRYCSAAAFGVVFGDSCSAGFYRNVAIGKKVTATNASAAIGVGNNVLSIGATSWAAGHNVSANSNFSTVLGTNASSNGFIGGFIYGDASTTDTVSNSTNYQFMARATGGVVFYTASDLSAGVELSAGGGSWSMLSDRNKKRMISPVNYMSFENSFNQLNLYSWQYKGYTVAHCGPMAQDFYHLFLVGESERYINMIDADGVILAGIKMLRLKLKLLEGNLKLSEDVEKSIKTEETETDLIKIKLEEIYEKLDN
ncbi:MAG: tail fiber domain-containing protein [Crocinitomicaceae bacterium]